MIQIKRKNAFESLTFFPPGFSLFLQCVCIVVNINIGTININGACTDAKRASLFKLCELKNLDVVFVQETHSSLF